MTKGAQCDRCNEFTEEPTTIKKPGTKKKNLGYIDGEAEVKNGNGDEDYHLCQDCTKKLVENFLDLQ